MLVTGVQAVGSKGMTAIQGAVVDTKDSTRSAREVDGDRDGNRAVGAPVKKGDPQPVVFPRKGLPMDHRPVSMRHEQAAARYRRDGGGTHDEAA
ncbi:MAG TPA: hypothetical protein VGP92_16535 [Acidimicrobiia bacterium]|jgi:hypothetical protein|nr:hypothetical protein [Acidimicrobiia bacterium]